MYRRTWQYYWGLATLIAGIAFILAYIITRALGLTNFLVSLEIRTFLIGGAAVALGIYDIKHGRKLIGKEGKENGVEK